MDSKKKKGTKVTVDSETQAVQPSQSDMSKYARAVSNKSKINYAELKLSRHDAPETEQTSEKGKKAKKDAAAKNKAKSSGRWKDRKKPASAKAADSKKRGSQSQTAARRPAADDPAQSAGSTAEERYSNALGSGDHYSSAIEKYYLKYPDAKRPSKPASAERKQPPKKKKKRDRAEGDSSGQQTRLSMAEIAVRNKQSSSVKEHARAARNAKARGVISTKVANRSVYRRKKRRSGALDVLMVTLLLVFLVSVGVFVFFDIKQIRVEGDIPYNDAQIRSICTFKKGSNILFIDTDGAEERVVRELPYVEECSIDRRLPSTVVINVKKADVLGVAEENGGRWSVLSTEGKVLESSADKAAAFSESSDGSGEAASVPAEAGSAQELAALRMVPLLTGVDVRSYVSNGFLTGKSLEQIRNFVLIRDAFNKLEMRLTSVGIGNRGYEAVYDDRIVIFLGTNIDARTVSHYLDEVHYIIFDQKKISETYKGEFRFSKNRVFFRYKYDVSEEDLENIYKDRRARNQKKLYTMAEIFMSTGKDWLNGRLKTE